MIKDIKAQNENVQPSDRIVAKLHADFPQCFTNEGKFDIEKFKTLVKENVDVTEEGYDLNFLGKNYANLIASTETETVIQPDAEHNALPENRDSQNVYISGDNLDALKHLLKSYAGKIKCIYIDPPYNTGSDGFVYADKFSFTANDLQVKLGVSEEKAARILDLTKRGSASHSAWLMFMAPRLMLARDLLTEDGVIFISIDDNEQANLKLLCDSVFGEENRLGNLPTIMNLKGNNDEYAFAGTHEYTVVYAKSKELSSVGEFEVDGDELEDWEEDEIGLYKKGANLKSTGVNAPREKRPNLYFPLYINVEKNVCSIKRLSDSDVEIFPITKGQEMSWRWSKEKFEKQGNDIIISTTGEFSVYKKQRPSLGDLPSSKPKSTLYKPQYSSGNGTSRIKELFGFKAFSNPKPTDLIYDLLQIGVNRNECFVLDFFSGSATSAEAIMQFNSNKKLNTKFIMVQLQEETPQDSEARKAGYKTIDEIGQERIRRAAAKIKTDLQKEISELEKQLKVKERKLAEESKQGSMFDEENPLAQEIETLKKEIENRRNILKTTDFGFRHYTLQDVPQNTLDKMEKFSTSEFFNEGNILKSFGKETVLATWMVRDGYGLCGEIDELKLADYTACHCGSHIYFIDGEGFDENAMIALIDRFHCDAAFNPQNIVLFGYSFNYTQTEMLRKNLNTLKDSAKNLNINLDIRY
ncbi:MAG: site-specific DNA-methyltransferase [Paludibacteraceae bacterium]|nr:site-specific DNA-methyltransferase [Paludibacteraceae bacterium]